MSDDAPPEEQISPETAYARSDGYTFNGINLFPFTAQRYAAASACGMAFGTSEMLKGADAKRGTYAKVVYDAMLVLYLCTVEGADVRRAMTDPDAVIERALEFGDKHKITRFSKEGIEAGSVFSKIIEDITASAGEPQPREGESKKKDPPDPNSPRRRRGPN